MQCALSQHVFALHTTPQRPAQSLVCSPFIPPLMFPPLYSPPLTPARKLHNLPDSNEALPCWVYLEAAQKVVIVHDHMNACVEEQPNLCVGCGWVGGGG